MKRTKFVVEDNPQAMGVLNIAHGGEVNGVVAHLLRSDGMMWEPKRAMNNGLMKTLEARTSRL